MIYSCFSGSLELSLLKFNIFLVCSFTKPLEVSYKKVLYAVRFPTKRSSLYLEKWKDYVRELIMHPRLLTAVDNEVLLKVLLRRNTKINTGIRKCIYNLVYKQQLAGSKNGWKEPRTSFFQPNSGLDKISFGSTFWKRFL